jgi:hypothetical protein
MIKFVLLFILSEFNQMIFKYFTQQKNSNIKCTKLHSIVTALKSIGHYIFVRIITIRRILQNVNSGFFKFILREYKRTYFILFKEINYSFELQLSCSFLFFF